MDARSRILKRPSIRWLRHLLGVTVPLDERGACGVPDERLARSGAPWAPARASWSAPSIRWLRHLLGVTVPLDERGACGNPASGACGVPDERLSERRGP